MKTKRKTNASAAHFTRGEKPGAKRRHGATRKTGRKIEGAAAERAPWREADRNAPIA